MIDESNVDTRPVPNCNVVEGTFREELKLHPVCVQGLLGSSVLVLLALRRRAWWRKSEVLQQYQQFSRSNSFLSGVSKYFAGVHETAFFVHVFFATFLGVDVALCLCRSPRRKVSRKERCHGTHRSSHNGSKQQVVEDAFGCLLPLSFNSALLSLLTGSSEHLRHTGSRQACRTTLMQRRPSSTTHRSTASRSKSEPLQPIHMNCTHSYGSLGAL